MELLCLAGERARNINIMDMHLKAWCQSCAFIYNTVYTSEEILNTRFDYVGLQLWLCVATVYKIIRTVDSLERGCKSLAGVVSLNIVERFDSYGLLTTKGVR